MAPKIIPFPASSDSSSNLNMVGFLPSSLPTKMKESQGNPEWRKMVREWKKEQILQGRHLRMLRSVSCPPVTSQTFCVPIIKPRSTVMTAMTMTSPQSLSRLLLLLEPSWGSSIPVRQPPKLVPGLLLGMTSAQVLKKMETVTKKTTKMPQQYRAWAKMPKGWAHVKEEEIRDEIMELWRKQRMALSDSTTCGRQGQSECRLDNNAVSLPLPQGST